MDRNNRPFAGLFGFKMRANKKFFIPHESEDTDEDEQEQVHEEITDETCSNKEEESSIGVDGTRSFLQK